MEDFVYDGDYLASVYGPGARDQRLESFGQGRWGDRSGPSVWLAVEATEVSRPEVLADATPDELLGVGRAWKSLEGWAFCGKLGVVRELIRRYPLAEDGEPGLEAGGPSAGWDRRLHHEVAAALGISVVAAGKLAELTWTLDNRLPGIRQALEDGRVDPGPARMIADEASVLEREELFERAEEIILGGLARCRTWADLQRLVQRAVITVDPDGARKRRERAEREDARLRFWREASGTCGLQGTGLPTDEALAARAHIEARAQEYKAAGVRRPVELLRIMALADILNGVPAAQRIDRELARDQTRAAEAGEQAARACRLRDTTRRARAKFHDKTRDKTAGKASDQAKEKTPRSDMANRSDTAHHNGTAVPDGRAAPGGDPDPGDLDGDDPFDGGPGDDAPGDSGPGDGGPGDGGPEDGGPGDGGPEDGGPGDGGPGDGGPEDGGPGDGGPGDDGPEDGGPGDGAPGDGGPGGGGRGDVGSREGAPDGGLGRASGGPCPAYDDGGGISVLIRANLTIPAGAVPWLAERPGPARAADRSSPGRAHAAVRSTPGGGPVSNGVPGSRDGPGVAARGNQEAARMPVRGNLTFPLLTLLGLAGRPGEAHGLGALDPALVRDLAAAGARHPMSEFCVIAVDEHGYAIGHGCCKPIRAKASATAAMAGSPGDANMTMAGTAAFHPSARAGPDGGLGSWVLTLPGAPLPFTVDIGPVPTYDCDHRYASTGYAPSGKLRHLIQVRDGECSFPSCSRHARESDFEHAHPFDKGGPTCACNAHACSRSCHRVKQSKGWTVTKPRPGWTQWTTMTGRAYRQGPWRYPA